MNEILLVLSLLVIYGSVLLVYRLFGKSGLYCFTAIATITANIEVLIMVDAFGMEQTLGNILFASTFLVTDIISEVDGKKAAQKAGCAIKIETRGSGGAKNVLTREEIAEADCIIVAADTQVPMERFDGKPVIECKVADGISKSEELIKRAINGDAATYHASNKEAANRNDDEKDSVGHQIYKHLMNGVSHMLPFVVGGGIMIALAFLLDDYSIDPSNFGMNTPLAAFFKTVGNAAFGFMLPILAGFIAMSIADRPGLAVGFAGGVLAMNGTSFTGLMNGDITGVSGGFLAALLALSLIHI
mgnify:CR=1 FL=1